MHRLRIKPTTTLLSPNTRSFLLKTPIRTYTTLPDPLIIPATPVLNRQRFSSIAIEHIHPNIFQEIRRLPFIRLLANGRLSPHIFKIYNSLDAEYLQCYRMTLDKLADKLRYQQDINIVRNFAIGSLDEIYKDAEKRPLNFAAQDYIKFLKNIAQYGTHAEIAAAILPCFWLYYLLASEMLPTLGRTYHPYSSWIERYSRPDFKEKVEFMKGLVDRLAEQSTPEIRARMLGIFIEATRKEYNFWNSAYDLGIGSQRFDPAI